MVQKSDGGITMVPTWQRAEALAKSFVTHGEGRSAAVYRGEKLVSRHGKGAAGYVRLAGA